MQTRDYINSAIQKYLNENQNNMSRYFSNIAMKTEDVFDLILYADAYRDLYPEYSDDENEYEDDYYFDSKDAAYSHVNEVLDFFNSLPNPIPIYRSILVKSLDDIDYSWLGYSWSFDKYSAINFAKKQGRGNVLLIGKTKFDNVNWIQTVQRYYQFSIGYDGYDENEIYVEDSDGIFDVSVEKISKEK